MVCSGSGRRKSERVGLFNAVIDTAIDDEGEANFCCYYISSECFDYVSESPVQRFDACAVSFHDLADAPDLVELGLELVNLSKDFVEAFYFGVGHFDCVSRAVVLGLGCCLGLLIQLKRG